VLEKNDDYADPCTHAAYHAFATSAIALLSQKEKIDQKSLEIPKLTIKHIT